MTSTETANEIAGGWFLRFEPAEGWLYGRNNEVYGSDRELGTANENFRGCIEAEGECPDCAVEGTVSYTRDGGNFGSAVCSVCRWVAA